MMNRQVKHHINEGTSHTRFLAASKRALCRGQVELVLLSYGIRTHSRVRTRAYRTNTVLFNYYRPIKLDTDSIQFESISEAGEAVPFDW